MADTTVGAKLVLDAGGAVKTMKEFKQEVKDAKTDLLNIQATFGETSKEALNAAKKVAMLEDSIKDASETAKLFDPSNRFQVLGNAVRGLVGGFTALQGALALVGVEGEEVQKTLLKVQGALALTEGLNTVADVTKDFQRLGSVLVQTLGKNGLIGVAIAGVAALGLAFSGVFSRNKELIQAQKEYEKATASARVEVRELSEALKQARTGVISKEEALKKFNSTIGQTVGETNDLNKAEKLLQDNADEYIKVQGLKAKSNFLLGESARLAGKAELLRLKLETEMFNPQIRRIMELEAADLDRKATLIEDKIAEISSKLSQSSFGSKFGSSVKPGSGTAKTPQGQNSEAASEEVKTIENMLTEWRANKTKEELEQHRIAAENIKNIDNSMYANAVSLTQMQTQIEANETAARIALAKQERDAKVQAAYAVGQALGQLSQLVGQQTAAGKALAIAQAVINTWLGVTEILATESVLPEPFATISRIANIVTVVAAGLNAVKNITKTKVPGGGGGGAGGMSTGAPLQPRVPAATNTVLNQQQLNQIGNATVRAFVVESDISNSQERVRRLNRAARI